MATPSLPEYLQFHGQARATGCLQVSSSKGVGALYLLDGDMVSAQMGPHKGLCALFIMMSWKDIVVDWKPGAMPPVVQARHSVDALLFQYAQLEDNGQTDEPTLIQMFGVTGTVGQEIKLMDLTQYAVSFEVLNTPFKGFVFFLEKAVTQVGRRDDCDVILPDASVSGHHCKILLEKHCIRVVDLGSTNGTFINDQIVNEQILQAGDTFCIGSVEIALHLKLNRRLEPANVRQAAKPAEAPSAPVFTQKMDPGMLKTVTSKVNSPRGKGPITWKNLGDAPEKKKTAGGSLFGKMFGKK